MGDREARPGSEQELKAVVAEVLSRNPPAWGGPASLARERELRRLVDLLCQRLRCRERSEFDHYGSGYASYVDAWFYRPPANPSAGEQGHPGLAVLLCRLAPYYCLMEGSKSWGPRGGTSYLPDYGTIDVFPTEEVRALATEAERVLTLEGYRRLRRDAMGPNLPEGTRIATNLSEPPYRIFDALFNWMD